MKPTFKVSSITPSLSTLTLKHDERDRDLEKVYPEISGILAEQRWVGSGCALEH